MASLKTSGTAECGGGAIFSCAAGGAGGAGCGEAVWAKADVVNAAMANPVTIMDFMGFSSCVDSTG